MVLLKALANKEGKFEGNVLLTLNWAILALQRRTGMSWRKKCLALGSGRRERG